MKRFGLLRLVLRGLAHHRVAGFLVAFGVAVATACVTGSLLVGASMEGSLRDQALQRLGRITDAFTSPLYHRDALAQSVRVPGVNVSRAIRQQGVAERSSSGVVIPGVNVTGVEPSFWSLFPGAAPLELRDRRAAISRSLARDLGLNDTPGLVEPREDLIITLARDGGAKAGTIFAHQRADKTQRKLRLEVAQVVADEAGGCFALRGSSNASPRNLFVSRDWLARAIGQADRFNVLLIERLPSAAEATALQQKLDEAAGLEDIGLRMVVRAGQGYVSIESSGVVLSAPQVQDVSAAAEQQRLRTSCTSIYLANSIAVLDGGRRESAYALLAATQTLAPFQFRKGGGADPGADGIWLNEWLAQDLQADVGARVRVVVPKPSWDGSPHTEARELTVRGIVELRGAGADPGLTPTVEGVTEAKTLDAWSLPFPVEKSRITPRDEEYWEKYGPTPKAFLSLEVMRQIWTPEPTGRAPDWVTSVRVALPQDRKVEEFSKGLEHQLAAALSLKDSGAAFLPVRAEALAGAQGNTDFGQLFMGLSFFIILAAIGLAASLLRLQAQRRSGEAGVLLACGFSTRRVAWLMLLEGAGWSALGAVLGVACGWAYAAFLIQALNTFWSGAVAGAGLRLHVNVVALASGCGFGLGAGFLAAWWGARGLARKPLVDLLGGWRAEATRSLSRAREGRWTLWLGLGLGLLALVLIVLSLSTTALSATAAFFGAGGALLPAVLLFLYAWLGHAWRRPLRPLSTNGLAFRSAALFRSRSLLVVGLLAAASFVLVSVASQQRDPRRLDVTQRDSGAGGFLLRADTALPLRYDLSSPEGRRHLDFSPEEEQLFAGAEVISFLASPGDEISCLNLARPAQPRLLAVSERMISRGGFRLIGAGAAGWGALSDASTPAVPIFGDAASVQWTLHAGLGQEYALEFGTGKRASRFAGVLPGSIFAGELLMGEGSFRQLYPQVDTPTCFLIAAPLEREAALAEVLRKRLAPWGAEVRPTREILAGFLSVQNTYLSVFLALGGLGLLLGTVGMVAVLVRNVHERRAELALLSASGFTSRRLAGTVSREYVGLLVAGLAIGTGAALIAVLPTVQASDAEINVGALTGLLAGVLLFGIAVCEVASTLVLRDRLLDALRQE